MSGRSPRIGVDGGASGSRCVVLDDDGSVIARVEGPPAAVDPEAPSRAADVVRDLARHAAEEARIELPAAALGAGLAGAGTQELRDAVARALGATDAGGRASEAGSLARRIRVVTDAEAARYDVFGPDSGIVVLAGTGAVTLGMGPSGERARADGWGPEAGDEGSGVDLARKALRAALRAHDQRGPETVLVDALIDVLSEEAAIADAPSLARWATSADRRTLAALAPAVIRAAEEGDPVARSVAANGAARLGAAVRAVHGHLAPWPEAAPVAAGGGLLHPGSSYRHALIRSLAGYSIEFLADRPDAARGAARLAFGG